MEKRLLKVLKALAELHDISLGDLLEGIVLHALDGRSPFNETSRRRIAELKRVYGLDLDHRASHQLAERPDGVRPRVSATKRIDHTDTGSGGGTLGLRPRMVQTARWPTILGAPQNKGLELTKPKMNGKQGFAAQSRVLRLIGA